VSAPHRLQRADQRLPPATPEAGDLTDPAATVGLGRRGVVAVSRLGFGSASIGNLYAPVSDAQATATTHAALDAGLRYLDTAPHYGAGLAESRLGAALAGRERASFTISTKVGRLLRPPRADEQIADYDFPEAPVRVRDWDFSAAGVRSSLASSLERLGLDRVDIALLHDPDEHEFAVHHTAYPALAELRTAGVLGAIGAGMNQTAMLTRLVRDLDLDVVLCAGRYTLLDPSAARELLPTCAARGTSVVIGGVYNSGLLADPRHNARYDYRAAPAELVARTRAIDAVCARHGVPLRTAALRFPFGHPAVASVLVGCRSVAEVEDNVRCFRHPVPGALWAELRRRDLIPADVPVPDGDD
jgi:D-threo-aldose 1-dehydrogenase